MAKKMIHPPKSKGRRGKTLQPKLGKVIRKIRWSKNMLIISLAVKARMPIKKIIAIERGKCMPTKAEMKKLSRAFDIPKEMIFLLSIEKKDVPKRKQEAYKILFPAISKMIYELI